jgi:hypothetical protein
MTVDRGPIIDVLYVRGATQPQGIAAQLGDNIPVSDVVDTLDHMGVDGLAEAEPSGRWKLTEKGAQLGYDRKGGRA